MSWLRSSSSLVLPARQVRLVRATLIAWLLVLAAGLLAPWAQARSLESVCSGAGPARWILGPQADGLAHAMHGLDCPLCMPQMAAPPAAAPAPVAALPRVTRPRRLSSVAWVAAPSACPPPARGPPHLVVV
ncbi:hypothetical protein N0K08_18200 [Acidovorax sp. Be4]|uniref:DUF2946 domain-containing protein n=1 Tax=Acidovorax bellezanensis TaxID=2976702 RepID=A0ABT2PTG1_9BURK|nr:DUF2946 family protein [Acidovorax sp. Be4]MCT9812567.1 hypothetical protein [Acidovorax sp. Be4]